MRELRELQSILSYRYSGDCRIIKKWKELLDHLDLMTDGKLKRAAVMLFYNKPGRIITGCYVKIGKFGEGSDLQYQDIVEGSLFDIADRVIDLNYTKYLKAAITYAVQSIHCQCVLPRRIYRGLGTRYTEKKIWILENN